MHHILYEYYGFLWLFYGLMISCEIDGYESKPSSKGGLNTRTNDHTYGCCSTERRSVLGAYDSSCNPILRVFRYGRLAATHSQPLRLVLHAAGGLSLAKGRQWLRDFFGNCSGCRVDVRRRPFL